MARRPAPSRNPRPAPVSAVSSNTQAIAAVQVDFMRPEIRDMLAQYTLIDDCCSGSIAVKAKQDTYLPRPNAADKSVENQARYEAYRARAVFYNVSKRTLAGMVGEVFAIDPQVNVPDVLDPVVKDANGNGVTLQQLSQTALETDLKKGRAGLFVDFPKRSEEDGPVTRQQQLDGAVRPTINLYQPGNIINWRVRSVGSKTVLALVVLRETYEKYDDGFAVELDTQFRVLRLGEDNIYRQEIWRGAAGAYQSVPDLASTPLKGDGQPLNEIPFTFIGVTDNSPSVDDAPMFDLCDLNLAHYRNSADYEESVYIAGQATPVLAGLTERWVKEVLKDRIELGSRAAVALPEGATASLLQMEERSAGFEAMEHKERQMVALGAKLVEQKSVQRTATEADIDEAGETSVLKTITKNVSAAFRFALEWAAIFQGTTTIAQDAGTADDEKKALAFELNTEFSLSTASTEEVNAAIAAWQKEAICYEEMRAVLKDAGLASVKNEVALASLRQARMDDGDSTELGPDGKPLQKQGGNLPGQLPADE